MVEPQWSNPCENIGEPVDYQPYKYRKPINMQFKADTAPEVFAYVVSYYIASWNIKATNNIRASKKIKASINIKTIININASNNIK